MKQSHPDYSELAKQLGQAIFNNNEEKRFELLKLFWEAGLMTFPEEYNSETATCLEDKLSNLIWKTDTKLGLKCNTICNSEIELI